MDATQQTQRQNFVDFWQIGQQQQIPSSSAPTIPSMPPAFFYSPSTNSQRPSTAEIQPNHPSSQQQSNNSATSTDPPPNASNTFQAALQPNQSFQSGNFDFFGTDRATTAPGQHPGFRSPLIGATPHFGQTAAAVGNFQNFPAGLLHAGSNVPLPSVVASVGFDCMGLMNNFGLNSVAATSSHSQFAIPQTPSAVLQSTSTTLMPLAMSAIYATGGGGIQRSSSFLNNSAMANRPPLPLGQSASTGALNNGTANSNIQLNQASQLFDLDLSNNSVANVTSAAVIAAAVSGVQSRPKINDDEQQTNSSFGPFSGAKMPPEIVKIPKETASIPLESSREGTSSSSAGGNEQRAQSQMSCQVCHLAASNGLHFGARTCAACAAFFRRSISDQKRYICKRSQRCVIRPSESGSQGYRKMCRNCRMKRCLEIGMLPENVQNKRNKREYYFVDALNNAIQQQNASGSIIGQQQSTRRESNIGIGMGQQIKNEVGKLLLGGTPLNGDAGQAHNIPAPPQLNPIEKFEPMEKESPPTIDGMAINRITQQQRQTIIGGQFQSATVPHQSHLLAPIQMMEAAANNHQFPIEFGAQKTKGEEEGRPIYSTPTTTTNNQQQQMNTAAAQFPWGITTLREI